MNERNTKKYPLFSNVVDEINYLKKLTPLDKKKYEIFKLSYAKLRSDWLQVEKEQESKRLLNDEYDKKIESIISTNMETVHDFDSVYENFKQSLYEYLMTHDEHNDYEDSVYVDLCDVKSFVYHREWLTEKLEKDFGSVRVEYVLFDHSRKFMKPLILDSLQDPRYPNGERIYKICNDSDDIKIHCNIYL